MMKTSNESLVPLLDESKSISAAEVSRWTGIKLRTIQKYARLGVIPGAFQPAGRRSGWRFKRKPLEEWWTAFDGGRHHK